MRRVVEIVVEEARLRLRVPQVRALIHCLDAGLPSPAPRGSLHLAFVSPESSGQLHAQFFGDPDPTDVMTFPGEAEDEHAGDLAVCPAVAWEAAPRHGTTFAEELALYIVHGYLHLAGLRDGTPAEQAAMRKGEAQALALLREQQALPDFLWKD